MQINETGLSRSGLTALYVYTETTCDQATVRTGKYYIRGEEKFSVIDPEPYSESSI
jgi:hypothetical protein